MNKPHSTLDKIVPFDVAIELDVIGFPKEGFKRSYDCNGVCSEREPQENEIAAPTYIQAIKFLKYEKGFELEYKQQSNGKFMVFCTVQIPHNYTINEWDKEILSKLYDNYLSALDTSIVAVCNIVYREIEKKTMELKTISDTLKEKLIEIGFPKGMSNPTFESVHMWLIARHKVFIDISSKSQSKDWRYSVEFGYFTETKMWGTNIKDYQSALEEGVIRAVNFLYDKKKGLN